MTAIERTPGIGIGMGFIVGGGYAGRTEELDATVRDAAETLASAYPAYDIAIRFNSDRHSGGAWLKTDDPDGIWLNAEVGICAAISRKTGKLSIMAHVGKRAGEYAHERVNSVRDALAYVTEAADLSNLPPTRP